MLLATLLYSGLITVHMLDGAEVNINPKAITMIRRTREEDNPARETPPGVNCVLWFVDGRYLSVTEECIDVIKLIEEASRSSYLR